MRSPFPMAPLQLKLECSVLLSAVVSAGDGYWLLVGGRGRRQRLCTCTVSFVLSTRVKWGSTRELTFPASAVLHNILGELLGVFLAFLKLVDGLDEKYVVGERGIDVFERLDESS